MRRSALVAAAGLAVAGCGFALPPKTKPHPAHPGNPAAVRLADALERPGDLGGSDSWKDEESCRHSGSIPMSCANAR
jgi:hypothetical protein